MPLRLIAILAGWLALCAPALQAAPEPHPFTVDAPRLALSGIAFELTITPATAAYIAPDSQGVSWRVRDERGRLLAEGRTPLDPRAPAPVQVTDLSLPASGSHTLTISLGDSEETAAIRVIPAWLSILPPLLAIVMALITRQVIVALFAGIWIGATFVYGYNPLLGFLHTFDEFIVNTLAKTDHVYILVFSLALGGMVGVISRCGGTQGIVEALARYARNPRGGQLATWVMGVLIFFDDYANTLIVGNTMRPLSDKLRISREKLSYLVDSTAAPVANIAIISTWIGYEISLISDSFGALGLEMNPYITFLQTIPYNFYPIFALVLGLYIAWMNRDFGPMLRAERRARESGAVLREGATPLANLASDELIAEEGTPLRWYNALIPVAVVIAVVSGGLVATGWEAGWEKIAAAAAVEGGRDQISFIRKASAVIGAADSFATLMWAAFIGGIVAIIMAVAQRILSLHHALDAWVNGIRSMLMAAIILTAAWAIGDICTELFTARYVIDLTRAFLSPEWLPLMIFLTAAVIAFATGTSWGTMAILMPIAIPLAHQAPTADPTIDAAHEMILLLCTTAAVLAGATFGDHCSPISDTTIMSSMASGADHIDHVRTQLPYALTAGGVACLFGYIPVGFDVSNWILLPLGAAVLFLVVRFLGKSPERH